MKPSLDRLRSVGTLICLVFLSCIQRGISGDSQRYQLLDGSSLVDDCVICDRPTILYPLRGEFDVVLRNQSVLSSRFSLTNIHFVAENAAAQRFELTGTGELEIGGEVALLQHCVLQLSVISDTSTNLLLFTNNVLTLDRALPNLSISCTQSNGTLTSVLYLDLKAAPVEEIWFLTHKAVGSLQSGDILSSRGRLVKSQSVLLGALGVTNPPPGLVLDALDVRAGYRFSLSGVITNTSIGPVVDGDFIAEHGPVIPAGRWRSAFGITLDAPDPGLDAVHFLDWGDTLPVDMLFSIRGPVFSSKLNRQLGRGDLLAYSYGSLTGEASIRRSNSELLTRFHPPDPRHDYGLDGVYLWHHGEIWFSLEEGFVDAQLGPVSEGDILSDLGFVVFRNADLLRNFATSKEADFGLSDFFVVTDAGYPSTQWILNPLQIDFAQGDVKLSWHVFIASGTVVQVLRGPDVAGPFEAVSPVITETQWIDPGVLKTNRSAIYKLREWH